MRDGPDIARIGQLLGDPARTHMLTALSGGQALTAGELAREAGITPQTASSHLSKLAEGALITARKQGRCVYYALASAEVAELLEAMAGIAAGAGHLRTRPGPKDEAMRRARVCYDHLAGERAVAMLESFVARGLIEDRAGSLVLSAEGEAFMRDLGVATDDLARGRRPLCRACLDWSERRNHLAGALGKALLDQVFARGWARRVAGARVVVFSAPGLAAFEAALIA